MAGKYRIILVGGSSHVGKSTLARALAKQFGWSCRSTDSLARHPGRPWQAKPETVPEHVAEHYLSLSVEELITDVHRHYKDNVWRLVEDIVASHSTALSTDGLILEGSAILPELAVTLISDNIATLWLTASNELFERRINSTSRYDTKSHREKKMIDKFLARTCLYNERMMDAVRRLGLVSINVENAANVDELTDTCLSILEKMDRKIKAV
ncbi:2-phosphoglycerate kinase [Candidatus Riflebacteria bacterium]